MMLLAFFAPPRFWLAACVLAECVDVTDAREQGGMESMGIGDELKW